MRPPGGKLIIVGVAIAAVVAAVVGGLTLLGSPAEERMRRIDKRRVDDLSEIARATDLYWTRHKRLPSSLEELSGEPGVVVSSRDPETTQAYEYRVLSNGSYELCAHFDRASAERRASGVKIWSHGIGKQCFQLETKNIRR